MSSQYFLGEPASLELRMRGDGVNGNAELRVTDKSGSVPTEELPYGTPQCMPQLSTVIN